MNYRISKKIYKRADFKLKSFIAANHDKRTTYDIAKDENILSGLERSIFISKQDKWTKTTKYSDEGYLLRYGRKILSKT